jgi:hypothetical protein
MGQGRFARVVAILGIACAAAACRPTPAFDIAWAVDRTQVRVVLRNRVDGQPIRGARLTIEGHMTHPGMAPVLSTVRETGAGVYEAELPLTMAGDWTLVVSGALADGRRVTGEHRFEIASVAPPS